MPKTLTPLGHLMTHAEPESPSLRLLHAGLVILTVVLTGCRGTVGVIEMPEVLAEKRLPEEKVAYVSDPIEEYEKLQDEMLREYETTGSTLVRERNAHVLSRLWYQGLLRKDIKDMLIDRHFKIVLLQVYGNYQAPNFVVECHQSFPFPAVWSDFTPTLYRNGNVEWAPGKPQMSHALSVNSSTLTSRTGGHVRNGDRLYYLIRIEEKRKGEVVWEKAIKTNEVIAQGLKE